MLISAKVNTSKTTGKSSTELHILSKSDYYIYKSNYYIYFLFENNDPF